MVIFRAITKGMARSPKASRVQGYSQKNAQMGSGASPCSRIGRLRDPTSYCGIGIRNGSVAGKFAAGACFMSVLRTAILIVLFIGLSGWFVGSSKTFQTCIYEHQHHQTEQAAKEGSAQFVHILLAGSNCTGEFIHKNGEAIIAIFTVILGIATILLWSATKQLVAEAKSTSARQLRAYVSIRSASCSDWKAGMFPFASITIVNAGQTPAYDHTCWAEILVDEFPLREAKIGADLPNLGKAALGPGSSSEIAPRFKKTLTPEEAAGLEAGTMALYAQGRLRYMDAFKQTRLTEFIYVSGGNSAVGSAMRPYYEGNNAT
jgi:hypothetical protein